MTLTDEEIQELKKLIQKGRKGYRIKHAQILLRLDWRPDNASWTYDRIKETYNTSNRTVTGDVEAKICDVVKKMKSSKGKVHPKSGGGVCGGYGGRPWSVSTPA